MKAKDIIDFQCGFKTFEDIQEIRNILEPLGFIYSSDCTQDHVPFKAFEYSDLAWEKRFFSGRYKEQSYNIHIRVHGGLNWNFTLNFRNFLSSNEDATYAFMQFKDRLAESTSDLKSYCMI